VERVHGLLKPEDGALMPLIRVNLNAYRNGTFYIEAFYGSQKPNRITHYASHVEARTAFAKLASRAMASTDFTDAAQLEAHQARRANLEPVAPLDDFDRYCLASDVGALKGYRAVR
jgi:hypothetical protein